MSWKLKTVAICGTSGSGKSTISSLLTRLYDVDGDDDRNGIFIDGTNIKDFPLQYLRSKIGIVSQEPVLFATSIIENIRFGCPSASTEEIIKQQSLQTPMNLFCLSPMPTRLT